MEVFFTGLAHVVDNCRFLLLILGHVLHSRYIAVLARIVVFYDATNIVYAVFWHTRLLLLRFATCNEKIKCHNLKERKECLVRPKLHCPTTKALGTRVFFYFLFLEVVASTLVKFGTSEVRSSVQAKLRELLVLR